VELDALPIDVLQNRIRQVVEQRLDVDALRETQEQEKRDRQEIGKALTTLAGH